MSESKIFKVAKIIDKNRVVINAGTNENIEVGMKFMLFSVSDEEIFDPDTGKSLGKLEITKGIGKVISVQEKMSILYSINKKKVKPQKIVEKPIYVFSTYEKISYTSDEIDQPFDHPVVGDFAKYIP